MPVTVFATGLIVEGPSRLDRGDAGTVVFVLDPFPDPGEAGVAHACEVVCPVQRGMSVMEHLRCGQPVAVSGELMMQRMQGPLEDDLTGMRVWIVATVVRLVAYVT